MDFHENGKPSTSSEHHPDLSTAAGYPSGHNQLSSAQRTEVMRNNNKVKGSIQKNGKKSNKIFHMGLRRLRNSAVLNAGVNDNDPNEESDMLNDSLVKNQDGVEMIQDSDMSEEVQRCNDEQSEENEGTREEYENVTEEEKERIEKLAKRKRYLADYQMNYQQNMKEEKIRNLRQTVLKKQSELVEKLFSISSRKVTLQMLYDVQRTDGDEQSEENEEIRIKYRNLTNEDREQIKQLTERKRAYHVFKIRQTMIDKRRILGQEKKSGKPRNRRLSLLEKHRNNQRSRNARTRQRETAEELFAMPMRQITLQMLEELHENDDEQADEITERRRRYQNLTDDKKNRIKQLLARKRINKAVYRKFRVNMTPEKRKMYYNRNKANWTDEERRLHNEKRRTQYRRLRNLAVLQVGLNDNDPNEDRVEMIQDLDMLEEVRRTNDELSEENQETRADYRNLTDEEKKQVEKFTEQRRYMAVYIREYRQTMKAKELRNARKTALERQCELAEKLFSLPSRQITAKMLDDVQRTDESEKNEEIRIKYRNLTDEEKEQIKQLTKIKHANFERGRKNSARLKKIRANWRGEERQRTCYHGLINSAGSHLGVNKNVRNQEAPEEQTIAAYLGLRHKGRGYAWKYSLTNDGREEQHDPLKPHGVFVKMEKDVAQRTIDPQSEKADECRTQNENITYNEIERLYDPSDPYGVLAEMEKKVIGELMEATDYLEELLMAETPETSEVTDGKEKSGHSRLSSESRTESASSSQQLSQVEKQRFNRLRQRELVEKLFSIPMRQITVQMLDDLQENNDEQGDEIMERRIRYQNLTDEEKKQIKQLTERKRRYAAYYIKCRVNMTPGQLRACNERQKIYSHRHMAKWTEEQRRLYNEKQRTRQSRLRNSAVLNAGVNDNVQNQEAPEERTIAAYLGLRHKGRGYAWKNSLTDDGREEQIDLLEPLGVFAQVEKEVTQRTIDPQSERTDECRTQNESFTDKEGERLYDPSDPYGVLAEMEKKVIEELMEATDHLEELLMAETPETSEVTDGTEKSGHSQPSSAQRTEVISGSYSQRFSLVEKQRLSQISEDVRLRQRELVEKLFSMPSSQITVQMLEELQRSHDEQSEENKDIRIKYQNLTDEEKEQIGILTKKKRRAAADRARYIRNRENKMKPINSLVEPQSSNPSEVVAGMENNAVGTPKEQKTKRAPLVTLDEATASGHDTESSPAVEGAWEIMEAMDPLEELPMTEAPETLDSDQMKIDYDNGYEDLDFADDEALLKFADLNPDLFPMEEESELSNDC